MFTEVYRDCETGQCFAECFDEGFSASVLVLGENVTAAVVAATEKVRNARLKKALEKFCCAQAG